MYSYGPLHMAEQKQGDQLEPTYSSSVRIRSVALGTCRKWWTIGRSGERGSGISILIAWQDDDDDGRKYSFWKKRNERFINYQRQSFFKHLKQEGTWQSQTRLFVQDRGVPFGVMAKLLDCDIVIIIIIISCWQHGYPWPSLATPPYRSSP